MGCSHPAAAPVWPSSARLSSALPGSVQLGSARLGCRGCGRGDPAVLKRRPAVLRIRSGRGGTMGPKWGEEGNLWGRQKAPDPLRTSCWGTEGGAPPGEQSSGAATDGDGAGNITPAAERHQKRPRIFSVPGEDALRLFPVPRVFKWFRFLASYCLVNFAALSSCCSDFCLSRVTS